MADKKGTPPGQVNTEDFKKALTVLLISTLGGFLTALSPMMPKDGDTEIKGLLAAAASGAVLGALQFINRWRRDNSKDE